MNVRSRKNFLRYWAFLREPGYPYDKQFRLIRDTSSHAFTREKAEKKAIKKKAKFLKNEHNREIQQRIDRENTYEREI